MSNVAGSSPAPSRKTTRLRGRDVQRRDDAEKSTAKLHAPPDPRMARGNPMRIVPDVAGFSALSKQEIKKDTRDIDKISSMMSGETDSDDDHDVNVNILPRPSCPPESMIHKKRRRLTAWAINLETMEADILNSKQELKKSRDDFATLEKEEERWLSSFESARREMTSGLISVREENAEICKDSELLLSLAIAECGPSIGSRKRGAPNFRDVMNELKERQSKLNSTIKSYERTTKQLKAAASSDEALGHIPPPAFDRPAIYLSIQELDYPEDAAFFAKSDNASSSHKKKGGRSLSSKTAGDVKGDRQSDAILTAGAVGVGSWRHLRPPRPGMMMYASREGDDDVDDDEKEGSDDDNSVDLISMVATMEESIRLNELAQYDLSPFFPPEEDLEEAYSYSSSHVPVAVGMKRSTAPSSSAGSVLASASASAGHWHERMKVALSSRGTGGAGIADSMSTSLSGLGNWKFVLGEEEELKLAQPFWGNLKDSDWMGLIDGAIQGLQSSRRKRKSAAAAVPTVQLSSFAYARTPFEVPLLVSPLSQFEDRYLGSVLGPGVGAGNATSAVPEVVLEAENEAFQRAHIQSAAAAVEMKIRRLKASTAEWHRQANDIGVAVYRAEAIHAQTIAEEKYEQKMNRLELIKLGMLAPTADEPPLSPLPHPSHKMFRNAIHKNKKNSFGKVGGKVPRPAAHAFVVAPTSSAADFGNSAVASTTAAATSASTDSMVSSSAGHYHAADAEKSTAVAEVNTEESTSPRSNGGSKSKGGPQGGPSNGAHAEEECDDEASDLPANSSASNSSSGGGSGSNRRGSNGASGSSSSGTGGSGSRGGSILAQGTAIVNSAIASIASSIGVGTASARNKGQRSGAVPPAPAPAPARSRQR